MAERILILGAGAVGRVYGRHLRQGGAEVSFLVRPKYRQAVQAGFRMANLNRSPRIETVEGFPALSEPAEVRAGRFDQLWLCISSAGLAEAGLGELIDAAGDALLLSFQPGLRDGELLRARVGAGRLARGIITFSAWNAPLPGEPPTEPHLAYWTPPLSPGLFEGPAAGEIAARLQSGGLPARPGPAGAMTARGSAILLPLVAAMECGGFTFAGLRTAPWAELAGRAARQALAISMAHEGIGAGPMGLLAHGGVLRLVSHLAPLVAPFDIERFFAVHFQKTGAQTMLALGAWIEEGRARGLPVDAIEVLRDHLTRVRNETAAGGKQ